MLRALLRREAAVRIDGHHLRPTPLGFLHSRPQVQVRDDRVCTPQDDQSRLVEALGIHADRAAERRFEAELAGTRAQRAVEQRRTEAMEEAPVHRAVLHHPHRAGIAAGQDGLGILGSERLQARGDLVERFVPADPLELPLALLSRSFHRI